MSSVHSQEETNTSEQADIPDMSELSTQPSVFQDRSQSVLGPANSSNAVTGTPYDFSIHRIEISIPTGDDAVSVLTQQCMFNSITVHLYLHLKPLAGNLIADHVDIVGKIFRDYYETCIEGCKQPFRQIHIGVVFGKHKTPGDLAKRLIRMDAILAELGEDPSKFRSSTFA